jgi:hypothetical protein
MALKQEDAQFLEQMVQQLESSIQELSDRESQLRLTMNPDRAEHLGELWRGELSRVDELELRASLDWRERELLWLWARLKRARSARLEAGQAIMRRFRPEGEAPPAG